MSQRILVVDDDPTIRRTLRINLRARGFEVEEVGSGTDALSSVADGAADVVVLDLGLPDLDGVEVLRRIRAISRIPVIVLSARQQSDDKVEALDEGADDYVTKPFAMRELVLRIRALARRATTPVPPVLEVADLRLDPFRREVFRGGRRALADRDRPRGGLPHPGR